MSAPTQPRIDFLTQQLTTAVTDARLSRHHRDCTCGLYRDNKGSPHCTREERIACMDVDRLLEELRRARF